VTTANDLRDPKLFPTYCSNFIWIANRKNELVTLKFNRAQWKVWHAIEQCMAAERPIRLVILKARRVGVSTIVQAFNFWSAHLFEHRTAITLAHASDSSLKLFEMQKLMYDRLAELPDGHPLRVKKLHLTTKRITFAGTHSTSQVLMVGKGTGRGFEAPHLHCSEIAFWREAHEAMIAVKNSTARLPHTSVFLESTPNGWGDEFHNQWLRAKKGFSAYVPVFIAWFDDDSAEMTPWFQESELSLDAEGHYGNEVELKAKHGLSMRQMAWRRYTIDNECDGDLQAFLQEYPSDDETCFLVSGRAAFDPGGLRYQLDASPQTEEERSAWRAAHPPCEIEIGDDGKPHAIPQVGGHLIIKVHPVPRHRYGLGADPSEGDPGSTASPLAVLDLMTLDFVAFWYGRTPPDMLADHAADIGGYYFDADIVFEANNHGIEFGRRLGERNYPNIVHRTVSAETVAQEVTQKPGFINTERNRQDWFNTYRKYVREAPKKKYPPIVHPQWVSEIATLVYVEDKAQAQEGCLHDTCVASAIILHWHRGDRDSPLEPLPLEVYRRALDDLYVRMARGEKLTDQDLLPYGLTCAELEEFDEAEHEMDKLTKRLGFGGMN
jgi:hypothetical protein